MKRKNISQSILDAAKGEASNSLGLEDLAVIEASSKIQQLKTDALKSKLIFPVEAFPKNIANIINTLSDCYGFPKDYYGLGMLSVSGAVLGNGFQAVYSGWSGGTKPILYSAIVGPSSIGKSHILNQVVKPIYFIEDSFQAQNQILEEKIQQQEFEYNTKQRNTRPEEYRPYELFINEATVEAIYDSQRNNPKGLFYFKDELSGWINGMNQYRKGTDQEFWLQNWSSVRSKVSRKKQKPVFINAPCTNVLGALTPNFLTDLAAGDRGQNGFFARVLFAYPDVMKKPMPSDKKPNPNTIEYYNQLIKQLYDFPTNFIRDNSQPENVEDFASEETINMILNEPARKAFKAYLCKNTISINATDDDMIGSIYGKMDSYCLRFALIIEMMQRADDMLSGKKDKSKKYFSATKVEDWEGQFITKQSVNKAILLADYFKKTAFKVVKRFDSPVSRLPPKQKELYKGLPDEFTTSIAIKIGMDKKIGILMGKSTIERFLNNREVFRKKAKGVYDKLYI